MLFSTSECAWSHVSITVLTRKIIGLRGFEFDKEIEKEHLYAAGDEPIDIQSGNKKYQGNLKLLKYEVDLMNDAAQAANFADITEVPHTLITITCEYKKLATDKIRLITAPGVAFSKLTFTMEQNAKMTEVTLPFLSMRIENSFK